MHLFAGAGGGILADMLIGHCPVCAVEIDSYCQRVLSARQKDGILPWFPIYDDIRTFDGKPWGGIVDIVSGGFPCQDISIAGRGTGIAGERSGLWKEMARIIREVRPKFAFVENVPALTFRGLDTVLADLAEMGYDAEWGVLGGFEVGNIADGKRLWIVATPPNGTKHESLDVQKYPFACSQESLRRQFAGAIGAMLSEDDYATLKRNPHDVVRGMDRLKSIGNGQVPAVAALAWRILTGQV
jgi:DNA (cytosine-5)-methyltransferase 1